MDMKMKHQSQPGHGSAEKTIEAEPTTMRNTGTPADKRRSGSQNPEQPKGKRTSKVDREIDRNIDDSFPASDAPAWSPTTAGSPGREDDDEPKEE